MSHSKRHIRFGHHRVTLYKRDDVIESSYFMRIYLKDEERYFKKSLGTKDQREAIEKAQAEVINLLAKLKAGERVVSITVADLVRKFGVYQDGLASSGQLSPRTIAMQSYRIRSLGMPFLATKYSSGPNTRLTSVDGNCFHDYLAWRLKKRPTIRRDVVRDELLVIRKMFLWGKEHRLCSEKNIPNWDFVIEREGAKRQRIAGFEQFRDFINTTHAWAKEDGTYNRRMTIQVIALVVLSGMRSGEVFGLKNGDVSRRGRDEWVISVRAETSKVRRARVIAIRSDVLAMWIDKTQIHKDAEDFVFCPRENGRKPVRDVFYHQYKSLRLRLAEVELDWFDLYHCRHWWVTNQLLAEQPIHLVARAAGTSTSEIESTYSHVLTEMTTRKFAERKVKWNADGTYEIVRDLVKRKQSDM